MLSPLHPVPAGRWVLGFSGGPDSVGLAALLRPRAPLLCYVDHGLRSAPEIRNEQRCVEDAAESLGLDLLCTQVTLEGPSESAARRARYAALHAMVRRHDAAGLILAHSADDRAETVIFNLRRGTGLRGLAAPRVRTVVDGIVRLRPALALRRVELRAAVPDAPTTADRSNRSTAFARARWRGLGLPTLAVRLDEDPVPVLCALADAADKVRTALEIRACGQSAGAERATLLSEGAATFPYFVEALRGDGPPLTARAYASLRDFLRAGRRDRGHTTPGGETWRIGQDGRVRVTNRA